MEGKGLDYIENVVSEAGTKLRLVKKKVTHGKLSIQRKKIKNQVLKKSKPRDIDRENICKKAREKAHGTVADTKRKISNSVRQSIREELPIVNPGSFTLSEAYGFDFIEEANGSPVVATFFDNPVETPISESLSIGGSSRNGKCRAIGIVEGCFQPIIAPDGERVFSRNKRLYDVDHWQFQLETRGLAEKVATRNMVGTIGHHDKRVDDKDFAEEKVSHVVTDLEIREDDEHGVYLWGRLEILDTQAGRALRVYYENNIPLYVSSRGGGKLLEVVGKDYKRVDKARYYCETFDVVRAPGFLEAMPMYYNVLSEEENNADNESSQVDEAKLLTATCEDDYSITEEDNNMKNQKKVTSPDTTISNIAEKLAELTDTVAKISADIYEAEEAPAVEEPKAEVEAPIEEPKAEVVEEIKEEAAPEAPAEEAPAVEEPKAEEAAEEIKEENEEQPAEEPKTEEVPADEKPIEEGEEVPTEEPKAEVEAPAVEEPKAEVEAPIEEACDKDKKKEAEEEKTEAEKKEDKVDEEWAKEDPKETAPATNDPHAAPTPAPKEPMKGDVYAHEDPGKGKEVCACNAPVDDTQKREEKPAVKDAVITEEAAPETEAPVEGVEVIDYKTMYEEIKKENEDAVKVIDEMIETFRDFGKRHREIVESQQSEINDIRNQLNSYKISEKFNVTVEDAGKMLSSKTYDKVVEELQAEEATKVEEEAQAKAEAVSESFEETVTPKAPAPRSIYSVFSAPKSENISESEEETKTKKVFSWF